MGSDPLYVGSRPSTCLLGTDHLARPSAWQGRSAAGRVGAGLVTLALPETLHPVIATKIDEATFLPLPDRLGDWRPRAANELLAAIKNGDWNEYHLVARGNVLTHILNGHVMSVVIDDDAKERKFSGQLGVQVHVGPPMKIAYRNFRLKQL